MKSRLSLRHILGVILLLPVWCNAVQSYTPVIADPVVEPWRWRVEEALAGQGVLCMDEASDGTLWFGAVGQMIRYDGVDVTRIPFDESFKAKITSVRSVPWASALLTLRDDRLLVLMGESLVLWSNGEWRILIQNAGTSSFDAQLVQGQDGVIWLFVPGCLWRIDAELTGASPFRTESESGVPKTFCLDRDGNPWVVEQTQDGRFNLVQLPVSQGIPAGKERVFPIPFGQPCPDIHLTAGDDGLIWYVDALQSSGLEAFDPAREVWTSPVASIDQHRFFSVLTGRDGSIWGGGTGVLLRYSKEKGGSLYDYSHVQLPRVALRLFETRAERLWVIGRGGYVYSMDQSFREWTTYEDLSFECETDGGVQWFSSAERNTVVSFNVSSNTWRSYGVNDGLIDRVYSVFCSSHGLLWAVGSHQKKRHFRYLTGFAGSGTSIRNLQHR